MVQFKNLTSECVNMYKKIFLSTQYLTYLDIQFINVCSIFHNLFTNRISGISIGWHKIIFFFSRPMLLAHPLLVSSNLVPCPFQSSLPVHFLYSYILVSCFEHFPLDVFIFFFLYLFDVSTCVLYSLNSLLHAILSFPLSNFQRLLLCNWS